MNRSDNPQGVSVSVHAELLDKYKNTCQLCGAINVPLTITRLTPLVEGGTSDSENLTLLCSKCHANLDAFQPREREFEAFLYALLKASPDYFDVENEPVLRDPKYRPNFLAKRNLNGKKVSVLIESKSRTFFRRHQLHNAIAQINHYRSIVPPDVAVLAFPGRILDRDRSLLEKENIEVWDLDYVANQFASEISQLPLSSFKQVYSLVSTNFRSPADELIKRLDLCEPGKSNWLIYQKLIKDIFEFLFTPPLDPPVWESSDLSKANRRDIIFPNYASNGFWGFLRERYRADYIVIDPKNYKNKLRKPQVLQISNYLKPHGLGMFAIITSRQGGNAGFVTTMREQWLVYQKLIILLTDGDIKAMLVASQSNGKPEEVIGQVIQEFRLSM